MDKPLRAKVSWDSHLFALRCMRRRLAAVAPSEVLQKQAEMTGEMKEDEEAHEDLPAELVETAKDSTLIVFGELIGYVDPERLFPNWVCLVGPSSSFADPERELRSRRESCAESTRNLQEHIRRKRVDAETLLVPSCSYTTSLAC